MQRTILLKLFNQFAQLQKAGLSAGIAQEAHCNIIQPWEVDTIVEITSFNVVDFDELTVC